MEREFRSTGVDYHARRCISRSSHVVVPSAYFPIDLFGGHTSCNVPVFDDSVRGAKRNRIGLDELALAGGEQGPCCREDSVGSSACGIATVIDCSDEVGNIDRFINTRPPGVGFGGGGRPIDLPEPVLDDSLAVFSSRSLHGTAGRHTRPIRLPLLCGLSL